MEEAGKHCPTLFSHVVVCMDATSSTTKLVGGFHWDFHWRFNRRIPNTTKNAREIYSMTTHV